MPTDGTYSPPFDEQAALAELERLRDAIEETRRRRSQTSDAFEAFVRSFRTPHASGTSSTAVTERPHVRDAQTPQAASLVPPEGRNHQHSVVEQPAAVPQPAPAGHSDVSDAAATAADRADHASQRSQTGQMAPYVRGSRSLLPLAVGCAVMVVVLTVLLMRPWKVVGSDEGPSSSTGAAPTTSSAPAANTPTPAASPAPPAVPAEKAHALEAELNTERRVWVRVLVDGQRVIERELPPGTRIPLHADRAIVIRAGDAGALHLTINGVDRGALGKDSEIVTRTFTPQ